MKVYINIIYCVHEHKYTRMQNLSIPPHTHTERERGKERETFALLHARTHTEREGHVQVCADVAPLKR